MKKWILRVAITLWLTPLDDENFMKYAKKYLKKG